MTPSNNLAAPPSGILSHPSCVSVPVSGGGAAFIPKLTATINRKGVLDIDTVKGCTHGINAHPHGGCYGLCYAARISKLYGKDFANSISREMVKDLNQKEFSFVGEIGSSQVWHAVKHHSLSWFRIGTMGDPSHDWSLTLRVCDWLHALKIPIIITKHWEHVPAPLLHRFKTCGVIFNTSISALDTEKERTYRLGQFQRIRNAGIKSVLRIVSCRFGNTENGKRLSEIQNALFSYSPTIDNPLRIPATDSRVLCGDIIVSRHSDLGGGSTISIFNDKTYIGPCGPCPDQCGVTL
jgi:hypothetical protein